MTWVRIDDGLDENPKVEQLLEGHIDLAWLDGDAMQELAGLAAVGLWALSLANSSRRLTDGAISSRRLRGLAPATHRPLADRLIEVGMFQAGDGGGIEINDFLEFNPSREQVLEQRQARAEAGRLGGQRSGETRREAAAQAAASASAEANASADAEATGQAAANQKRTPARTRPLTASLDSRERDHDDQTPAVPDVSYRGKHVARQTVRAAISLLDVFNDATGRTLGAVKGDGTPSADLKQIVGALLSHPNIETGEWERAIRNTVANPPGWLNGRSLQLGDITGERAIAHALANDGSTQPVRAGLRPVPDPARDERRARGAAALRAVLNGTDGDAA